MPLEVDDAGTLTVGSPGPSRPPVALPGEVKAGRSITVTEHGTVIATIVPMRFSERTMQLYREGKVELPTLPKRPVDDFKRVHVEGGIQDILREVRGG